MPDGPYHPAVDEARESRFIVDFRKWIVEKRIGASAAEVEELGKEVEIGLQEAQDKIFLKHLDPKHHYISVGKAAIGDGVGILIPGASTVMSIVEETVRYKKNKEQRWQGFVVDARGKFRSR